MTNWYMLTVIGNDKAGIVSKITKSLFDANCHLGEASMIRLGGNFTIMMMVTTELNCNSLKKVLEPVCDKADLRLHVDEINGKLHDHHVPDILITVTGADRSGIVAQVTEVLFHNGLDILDLTSDVAGTEESPIYIMQIEATSKTGIEALENDLAKLKSRGIDIQVSPVDTLIG